MLRSLWLLLLYAAFLGLGVSAPFVATLGYVWVDTFRPQNVAYIGLNQMPVALIMAAAAFGSYILLDRRSPPRLHIETILQVALAAWVTVTLQWAEMPDAAWGKWDWAVKTLLFAAFVPYVIRSCVQIEAFVQIYVFSLAANFVPFGLKTLISGGGYGVNLGLEQGNTGLSEGGLLSTVCLMIVPLALYLGKYGQLVPRFRLMPLAYWGIAALAIVTAIGTYERSALFGLTALGLFMWLRSRHKISFGVALACVTAVVIYTTTGAWMARISTIGDYQSEGSALVRVLVWKWTLSYSATHPLGGGFMSYLIDHVEVLPADGEPGYIQIGRAFHSIYFELLGEQGYPGLAMFLATIGIAMFRLGRSAKRARGNPELRWVAGLSEALQNGLAVFLASGAFVGIAFQPMCWYFVALSISVNAYLWRVEHQRTEATTGWRSRTEAGGWRNRRAAPTLPASPRV